MLIVNLSSHVDVTFQWHDFAFPETQVDVIATIAVTWTDCDGRLTVVLQDFVRIVVDALSRAGACESDGDIGVSIKWHDELESIIVVG